MTLLVDMLNRELTKARAELAATRQALQRIEDGRYGVIYDALHDLDDPKPRTVEIIARLDRLAAGPVGVPAEPEFVGKPCTIARTVGGNVKERNDERCWHDGGLWHDLTAASSGVPAEQPSQGHRLSTARVGERVEAVLKGTLIAYDPDSGHWTLETDGTDHVSWRIELHWSQPFRPVAEPLVADPPAGEKPKSEWPEWAYKKLGLDR